MTAPRFRAVEINGKLAGMMPEKDRKEMGIETDAERSARLEREDEDALQEECENILALRIGMDAFLHLSKRAREKSGWPDLVFPLRGKFVAVELKARNGVVSEDQKRVLGDLMAQGAHVHVVRRFLDFKAILDADDDFALRSLPTAWYGAKDGRNGTEAKGTT